jgi:hypothetical protein
MMIGILKQQSPAIFVACHAILRVFVVRQFCAVFVVCHAISRHIRRPSRCCMHNEIASSLGLSGTR